MNPRCRRAGWPAGDFVLSVATFLDRVGNAMTVAVSRNAAGFEAGCSVLVRGLRTSAMRP